MTDIKKDTSQMGISHHTEVFKASDGCELFLRRWSSEQTNTAAHDRNNALAVFIVHGMGEHSLRYQELASHLVTALPPGSLVYCHDQRGHGQTAVRLGKGTEALGEVPCEHGLDPMSVMADDVVCMVTEKLPRGMEYLLIGHSMGSVVTRLALERLMQLDVPSPVGMLLSGPPASPGRLLHAIYQCLLWAIRSTSFGPSLASKIIFGGYDSQIRSLVKNPSLPQHSWLSINEDNVRKYTEDPFCGHDVSIDLWSSLLSNITKLNEGLTFGEMKEVSKVKVLVMGGADDMCTERGKGVHECAASLAEVPGLEVKQLLYSKARHEIWHETEDMRMEAVHDTIAWAKRCGQAGRRSRL
ncbi:conserved hypothetical protein [Perkinsus marinus ATCC 50983]|uniref:Serine aminopeptidase S33 domain-containing protein n=1 Tax=Perkinsus marinus (strain ATCC 50983 / TXsc) TaxID=423536 RepID=C5L1H1_PERM5|nr:conserved hypothetical protein [Perkinsus marinus ATCC 50983]EER09398.1 conserved hypothetical protein [Perkinsus marinus ATCC 50983]|eukprot:XP_002777582.1 conserved hypothetical protein [Perkinsus marinus ATCC 50983]